MAANLRDRGFTVIDRSDKKFNECDGIIVQYIDHWKWDVVMYLHSLQIIIVDCKTNKVIATSVYKQGFFHSFPNSVKIVNQLFSDLDSKNIFQ